MSKVQQVAVWTFLWCFWSFMSRNNHPTLFIDLIATGLMLACFAAVVYFNWLVLVPRFWYRRQFGLYWLCLAFASCALTAAVVVLIQEVYDMLWGPDLLRFGFWVNYGLDFTGMMVHLALAALVVRLVHRRPTSA